ncbi:nuclear transport factor 2 family protein (plasmid) [Pedobacter sp. BS3]|uniref:nuclear transport factor 2 family protein n=1 Tax=Pedobacter sp. BS3 TaxID=2567937 RepID=UPI0011EC02B5|nr:nuclear transport factor 2 family protein [Pedobacter sp. BS3]TZF85998.1 nuclear transport factor 2 family protein [Pedobacter sp. BS3]
MENQILQLEKKYWKGMQDGDFETVKSLSHFPCIVAGKNGVRSVDEATFKMMFDSGKDRQLNVLNISDTQMQKINEDSAVIAYLIELEYNVQGKKSSGKCACTSTWVKENGKWVCALHTETDLQK